jgi:hypothetical protein
VAFRFEDLRSLFKLEGQARIAAHEPNANSRIKGLKDEVIVPQVDALSVHCRLYLQME